MIKSVVIEVSGRAEGDPIRGIVNALPPGTDYSSATTHPVAGYRMFTATMRANSIEEAQAILGALSEANHA